MLTVKNVCKHFDGIAALDGVELTIDEGEIHGIIGPNGSGKTTLFNCLTGISKADSGSVVFDNVDIANVPARTISEMGIKRSFQDGRLVRGLTVLENVMLGDMGPLAKEITHAFRFPSFERPFFNMPKRERKLREKAYKTLETVGLTGASDKWVSELVWAERQLVQLARTLMAGPKLLLLDEPNSGMGKEETKRIDSLIRAINERGMTVAVISHDMKWVLNLAEKISVLNFGKKISEGGPSEIRNDPKVLEAYLGSSYDEQNP